MPARIPFAIVQHGNQYLIADGYANREGIHEILDGFAAIFALHLRYRVPLNLHLSGTLLEAIAWHRPDFFDWIKTLRQNGLLEFVGSAYAQNIMPLFSASHNLWQMNEALRVYATHLEIDPHAVKCFWVPERVWQTASLAPLLHAAALLNGGYQTVLLDYRLTYPLNGYYETSPRKVRDQSFIQSYYGLPEPGGRSEISKAYLSEHPVPYVIEHGEQLVALPIFRELRYCVPPREALHWQMLAQLLTPARLQDENEIYVYADDLEKAAGVGPWGARPWSPCHVGPYEHFLQWLSRNDCVEPILISRWLETHPPHHTHIIEPGTYFELAHTMQAGEDYRRWWHSPDWRPCRSVLAQAEQALCETQPAQSPLHDLAWKQLLACSYETAWHDADAQGQRRPAPWAKALASHARAVLVICAAARWLQQRDGRAHVLSCDVDDDGHAEIILCNDHLYAVFTPQYGGRLVYLFDLTHEGALVVGNPADDWNWQTELNQFMQVPRNHPGAFADVGHENDAYTVQSVESDGQLATLRLVNHTAHSMLCGTEKIFMLHSSSSTLHATYRLPQKLKQMDIEFCLSPDYLTLLREGRRVACARMTEDVRGWCTKQSAVYVHKPPHEPLWWEAPIQPECGHGFMLRLSAAACTFQIELGVGEFESGSQP